MNLKGNREPLSLLMSASTGARPFTMPNPGQLAKKKNFYMSTQIETVEQRVERELISLREHGVLKKPLPTITRSTFEKLEPRSQAEFCLAGGRFTDDPAPEKKPLPAGGMLRSKFDALDHDAQIAFIKKGGKLYDDADVFEAKHHQESPDDKAETWLAAGLGLGLSADDLKELRAKLQTEGQE